MAEPNPKRGLPELVESLLEGRPPPLAWVARWSAYGEPVAAAWAATGAGPRFWLLAVADLPRCVRAACALVRATCPCDPISAGLLDGAEAWARDGGEWEPLYHATVSAQWRLERDGRHEIDGPPVYAGRVGAQYAARLVWTAPRGTPSMTGKDDCLRVLLEIAAKHAPDVDVAAIVADEAPAPPTLAELLAARATVAR